MNVMRYCPYSHFLFDVLYKYLGHTLILRSNWWQYKNIRQMEGGRADGRRMDGWTFADVYECVTITDIICSPRLTVYCHQRTVVPKSLPNERAVAALGHLDIH